jgi:hypothetical protein
VGAIAKVAFARAAAASRQRISLSGVSPAKEARWRAEGEAADVADLGDHEQGDERADALVMASTMRSDGPIGVPNPVLVWSR